MGQRSDRREHSAGNAGPSDGAGGGAGHYTVRVVRCFKEILPATGFITAIRWQSSTRDRSTEGLAAFAACLDLRPRLDPVLSDLPRRFQQDAAPRFQHRAPPRDCDRELAQARNAAGKYMVTWEGGTAGFIAHEAGRWCCTSSSEHRGRGTPGHLWQRGCADLVRNGFRALELDSIAIRPALISTSMGLSLRNPVDLYNRLRELFLWGEPPDDVYSQILIKWRL